MKTIIVSGLLAVIALFVVSCGMESGSSIPAGSSDEPLTAEAEDGRQMRDEHGNYYAVVYVDVDGERVPCVTYRDGTNSASVGGITCRW